MQNSLDLGSYNDINNLFESLQYVKPEILVYKDRVFVSLDNPVIKALLSERLAKMLAKTPEILTQLLTRLENERPVDFE